MITFQFLALKHPEVSSSTNTTFPEEKRAPEVATSHKIHEDSHRSNVTLLERSFYSSEMVLK
jgi:hypothetical protein